MRRTLHTTAFVFLILTSSFVTTEAQNNVQKFQFGISAGVFVYQGDLAPSSLGSYRTLRPAINLFAAKLLSSSFALRGNLAFGGLKGDDAQYDHPAYRQQRNFNFSSPLVEISGLAEWNILNRNFVSRGFAPYLFAGVGYSFLKIRRDYSNLNAEYFSTESAVMTGLTMDQQQRLPGGLITFPVGLGARYYLSDRLGVSAETSYRIMSNDYLDGFSQAANPNKTDHYYNHSKKNMLACPVIGY